MTVERHLAPREAASVGGWSVAATETPVHGGKQIEVRFRCNAACTDASVGVELVLQNWSVRHYLCMPGSIYAANRFPALHMGYSPRFRPEHARLDLPNTISDVQRLSLEPGPSLIDSLTGEYAFPAAAIRSPDGESLIVITEQGGAWGDHGMQVEESPQRDRLSIRIMAPGVRAYRARHMVSHSPSDDRGGDFAAGDVVTIRLFLWTGQTATIPELFDRLLDLRHVLGERKTAHEIPISAAAQLVREHFERDSWDERLGVYIIDCTFATPYIWATGWCGGLIYNRAFALAPEPQIRERSLRNVATMLGPGQSPCGLLWGKYADGLGWTGDFGLDDARPWSKRWTLVRRQGDALYYLLRTFATLERDGWQAPADWLEAVRRFAMALVQVWECHGQLGQFLDQDTGELVIGGSTSGGIVPGALILAYQRFGDPRMRAAAEGSGEAFADHLARGVTTGGPGDALQCPDSESVAALVESYGVLYSITGERHWLELLAQAAAQAATWVMPYDYRFPAGSEFARLQIHSAGTVFANAQNKHSAPGLCTYSGLGLLTLHRATGDLRPLRVLADIAHALPPLVSRDDRPIHAKDGRPLASGWINERVNTNDWDDNTGGVFHGSCWCETSLLLTWAELPGVYARPDLGWVVALDHVEARLEESQLILRNPTRFPATVTYLVERAEDAAKPFGPAGCGILPAIELQPGEQRVIQTG